MVQKYFKNYWLVLLVFVGCKCGIKPSNDSPIYLPNEGSNKEYLNLEAIDLGIEAKENFSFEFNGKELAKEGDLYISEDLMIYQTKERKWQATVIGKGGISSKLKISNSQGLLQEVAISTTNKVFGYQHELGPEWPGMHNIGNTCFANSIYKLMARCSGFDQVLGKDIEDGIHTVLRNIVNGIRLGKRSALHEEIVNKKISKLFLDKITKKSGESYNCGQQNDSYSFFRNIEMLLYPKSPSSINLVPPKLDQLINKFRNKIPPFKHLVKDISDKDIYQITHLTVSNFIPVSALLDSRDERYLSLPQFFMYYSSSSNGFEIKAAIIETVQVPLWDYTTDRKIEERTYKLIGFAYHLGSSIDSGHYMAHINFNKHGWYGHSDSTVTKSAISQSINTRKLVALYELQE